MPGLDYHQPPPHVGSLQAAQTLIDQLWGLGRVVVEQRTLIEQLRGQVQAQAQRIEQLEEQLRLNSGDSSKPPASDDAKARAERRKRPASGRPRGGQPGHRGQARGVVDEVDRIETYYPDSRCPCGGVLALEPEPAVRHQVFDLPEVRYTVTEHRRYGGRCARCGRRQVATLPAWVPAGQMGPGLISTMALLNGRYHLSLRQVQHYLSSHWQLDFSLGAISESQGRLNAWLAPLHEHIGHAVRRAPVAHADETTHYHHGLRTWLWTLCTERGVYFMAHFGRGKTAARALLSDFAGVLITDRYGAYNDLPPERRQLCWAHVIRNLERIARRPDPGGGIGTRLVRLARLVIRLAHQRAKGPLSDARYRHRLQRLRATFQAHLQRGQQCTGQPRTARQCQALLDDEPMLWTFLRYPGLPLTNNTAERALRPYVIWRKISFATQSPRGLAFRPRLLSVIATARHLGLNTHGLLRRVCAEGLQGLPITPLPIEPPLLPKPP